MYTSNHPHGRFVIAGCYICFHTKSKVMEEKQITGRRSRQEVIQLLDEYDKTMGITVKAFCRLHQINESAFYSARKRHRSGSSVQKKAAGFVEIKPAAPEGGANSLFAEVNGIRIYQAVPAAYLKSLAS